jgi:hypothetical protein
MKKLCGFIIGIYLFIGMAAPVQAYDEDMHYYMIYWMSKQIGFTDNHSALLALSTVETDLNWDSSPLRDDDMMSQSADQARRLWHFPAKAVKMPASKRLGEHYLYFPASQNNYYGLYNIVQAQSGLGKSKARQKVNPYYMGMSLHAYMDTYSHEGFESILGHATAGHDPDRPHWFKEKTEKMLDYVFTQLVNYGYASGEVDKTHLDTIKNNKAHITGKAWEIIDRYESIKDSPFLDLASVDIAIEKAQWAAEKTKEATKAVAGGVKKGAVAVAGGVKKGAGTIADGVKKGAGKIGGLFKKAKFWSNSAAPVVANGGEGYLHDKILARRANVWLGELGQDKKLSTVTRNMGFNSSTWKKNSLDLYKMPDAISFQALKDQGFEAIGLAANSFNASPVNNYSLPESLRMQNEFAFDFCSIVQDMDTSEDVVNAVIYDIIKNKPHLILNPFYPEEYAQQIQCVRALVSTRDGLNAIIYYLGDDDRGSSQMERLFVATKLIRELNWKISDMAPVVERYLSSDNKDIRLFSAWVAHMYDIEPIGKLFNIFDRAMDEERRGNSVNNIEKEGRVVHYLPISDGYLDLWKEYFQTGLPDEAARASSVLYFIGTYGAPDPENNSMIGATSREALDILQKGVATNSTDSFQEVVNYWRARSFEDIDEQIQNSDSDQTRIRELNAIIKAATQTKNYSVLQAAATAASTYSPEDGENTELLETLANAMEIENDTIKAEVAYAFQEISGKSMDLTEEGLETVNEDADTWIKEKF